MASASGEYCVSRCGAGAGGGGRREAALRRLRAPHSRTRSREGRCCPAAAPGPWGLPPPAGCARRVLAPRDCVTGPPHVTTAASARLGPGRTFCRPGDVSASGVAWLPRRSPVPLPLTSPGETLTPSPRVSAASQRRASHLHVTPSSHLDTHPSLPANHGVSFPPLQSPCARSGGRNGDGGGTESWTTLRSGSYGGTQDSGRNKTRTFPKFALLLRYEE